MVQAANDGLSGSPRRGIWRALAGAMWLIGLGGPVATGCGSTSTSKAGLATGCTVNSDCNAPLVCTFGLCHTACKASVDCPAGATCVQSGGAGVCQLGTEVTCTYKSDCDGTLICAADRRCRNQCQKDPDCLTSQICAQGACADRADLTAGGTLKNAAGDGGPGAGSGGKSGSGQGGSAGGGGAAGAPGGPKDAGVPPGAGGFPNGAGGFPNGAGGFPNGAGGFPIGAGGFPTGCGQLSEPCCGNACSAPGTVCGSAFRCQACGAASQLCCAGDMCATATRCVGGSCVSCGALTQPCCGSTCNATLSCVSGTCDVTCTPPKVARGGVCIAPPPRPVGPVSGSNVNTRVPKLSWVLSAGYPSAHVEVCKDRACANVLFSANVTGTSVEVGTALPPGLVFWRLFANDGGTPGTVSSAVWEMQVEGAHDAPSTAAWGAVPDFNGDGFADVVMSVRTGSGSSIQVYGGSASGLSSTSITLSTGGGAGGGGASGGTFPVGDLDGDGFVDLVAPNGGGFEVYRGSSSGLAIVSSQTINSNGASQGSQSIGDVNGDGYADMVLPTQVIDVNSNALLAMNVYLGGPSGLNISPQSFTTAILRQGQGGTDTGDVNGDGYADVIVANKAPGGAGTAAVFYGGPTGLSQTPTTVAIPGGGGAGASVSCAGDVNGDGYDDVLAVGSSVSVYHGGPTGLSTSAAATLPGGAPGSGPVGGAGLLGLGDMNGDGYSDIVATGSTFPTVTVYLGSAAGLTSGGAVALQATPPPSFVVSNATIETISALGDVNGDGFADLGLEIDWVSQSQLHNHLVYIFSGGGTVSTAPSSVLPLSVSAIR